MLSTEAIIAIVGLVVALPPALTGLAILLSRRRQRTVSYNVSSRVLSLA